MGCQVQGYFAPCQCGCARAACLLATLGGLILAGACSSARPAVCSERDAGLILNEAQCLALVGERCAEVPADKPCAFEEECKGFTRERCK